MSPTRSSDFQAAQASSLDTPQGKSFIRTQAGAAGPNVPSGLASDTAARKHRTARWSWPSASIFSSYIQPDERMAKAMP